MGNVSFLSKTCRPIHMFLLRVHYCTAHTYSTKAVIDASRLIKKFDHCCI